MSRKYALAIEKIQKTFLWIGMETKKRLPLIAWENVCMPKGKGGLGLRRISFMNELLLAKFFGDGIRKRGNGGIFGILNIIGITLIFSISFFLILIKWDLRFGRMLRNLNTF